MTDTPAIEVYPPAGAVGLLRYLLLDGLGQRQATRIRPALTSHRHTTNNSPDDIAKANSNAFAGPVHVHDEATSKESIEKHPENPNDYPHTFITDRVGLANPPRESVSGDSGIEWAGVSRGDGE